MKTISVQQPINLKVVRFELDFTTLTPEKPRSVKKPKKIKIPSTKCIRKLSAVPPAPLIKNSCQKREVKDLVEELLNELYAEHRDWSSHSTIDCSHGSTSAASLASSQSNYGEQTEAIERSYLEVLDKEDLKEQSIHWDNILRETGERLARCVRVRDRLRRQQKRLCAAFTVLLRHISPGLDNGMEESWQLWVWLFQVEAEWFSKYYKCETGETSARFGITPSGGGGSEGPGEGGYAEWLHAMRLVARLPAGVPQHFRRKLWLTLAERHLTARGIDWPIAERACFRGTALPDDEELGAQILKDLHRTGCSLFCGAEGRENQAMLRRVLLAYARWNKDVGYCQGFNMLAAIILEVMDKSESDSLKVMIYLVEAVLPEGYFADDLRGLSADMAAFRDLLRLRLPRLAHHMDHLQRISDGGGVEPPLPDVFTMQWFLTLYATWLPRESLIRIWDLILLDGNEVLLLTALAIWDMLQDRILSARSADEFYSCMGGGAGAVWEAGEALVVRVVAFGSAPELPRLRSLHRYRVAPPAPPTAAPAFQPPLHSAMQSMTKRGLRLFYSEDEGDSSDDGSKMALATVIPRREDRMGAGDRLSLDIGALKRQYARLRERQRQAHVILAAACARHAAVGVPTSPTSLTVNNLLLGKSAIVSSRGRRLGPPPGAVPPSRQLSAPDKSETGARGCSSETISWNEEKSRKSLSRRNSVKWKDIKKDQVSEKKRKASIDLDEAGDGVIVSEIEANEMIASLRSRSSSETSSYSSHSASSTDTSLCDENERASDSDQDLPDDDKQKGSTHQTSNKNPPNLKDSKITRGTVLKEKSIISSLENDKKMNIIVAKPIKNITEYLDSAAGEPLRTYIDGFETKLKDSLIVTSSDVETRYKTRLISPCSPQITTITDRNEVLQRLNKPKNEESPKVQETIRSPRVSKSSKNFTDLSPIDLSPCNYGVEPNSPYDYDFHSNFMRPTPEPIALMRPPDIIDSFAMYPNFVPDIDLSERNESDVESPSRSPGAESIIVSEDEPPIPLKIDKYFEHSPEFFGARVTYANNSDIPNRRPTKRLSRQTKKPDSLTLQSNHNEKLMKNETERASSLPHGHSYIKTTILSSDIKHNNMAQSNEVILIDENKDGFNDIKQKTPVKSKYCQESFSPKDYFLRTGRKNSERALQIIQENSKILSRILTKQSISDATNKPKNEIIKNSDTTPVKQQTTDFTIPEKIEENKIIESPLLKESTSDSLIGYRKRNINTENSENNDFVRTRPISIDDPFSLDLRNVMTKANEFSLKSIKSPSSECLGNKTDIYGWENKGFLAKREQILLDRPNKNNYDFDYRRRTCDLSTQGDIYKEELLPVTMSETRHFFSGESKISVTLPSSEAKDTSTYERRFTSDDYNYPFSSKYNDFVLSKASDICSKTVDQGPKICENLSKTENSQVSDFAHVVTSSISFTYEPSVEDDSPTGAKSNSSDTLCQIMSLDQVSTPISPKIFPNKDTPSLPKDNIDISDKTKVESDDTCSAITSLIETDTLSSLSYPRSPSTGSYHPFPTRPVMRMPKELGVRLGMYPKDTINSPPK